MIVRASTANPYGFRPWNSRLQGLGCCRRTGRTNLSGANDSNPDPNYPIAFWSVQESSPGLRFTNKPTDPGYSNFPTGAFPMNRGIFDALTSAQRSDCAFKGPVGVWNAAPSGCAAVAPSGTPVQTPPSTGASAGSAPAIAPSASSSILPALPSWVPDALTNPVSVPIVGSVPLIYLLGAGAAVLLLFGGGSGGRGRV
jgi:hypothetical protein